MSRTRSRVLGMSMATALAVTTIGAGAPTTAADSPEAAIDEFFDIAASGDFSGIAGVVCGAEQEAVREAFDITSGLPLDAADPLMDALSIDISDREVTLLNEEDDTATVRVSATMSMHVAEDQVEALVRAILEADLGPDDPPVSDDDVEEMMGFMGAAFDQTLPIDEEVTVVREDGEWLVCGGLIDEPEEPAFSGLEPTVSTEGVCGITSPEELSTLSALRYDSSGGFAEYCSFYTTDFDTYHTTTVSLDTDIDIDDIAFAYGADQETEVAGVRALASGPDAYTPLILTQIGPDVLQVSVTIDYDAGVDPLAQAALVTELLMPRMPEFREALVGPEPEATPEPTPQISLCDVLPLAELNELTALGFDESSGSSEYCSYTSYDGDPGYHTISISTSPLTLDDYRQFMAEPVELTVGDQPALSDTVQLIVELPGGSASLAVSAYLDSADESTTLTADEVMRLVAERVLPVVPVPEPLPGFDGADLDDIDLDALMEELGELDELLENADMTNPIFGDLPRPMCDYFDLEAINELGVLEFDDVSAFFDEMCAVSQLDFSSYSSVMAFVDPFTLDEQRTYYPDGTDLSVGGLPAYASGSDLWVATEYGSIAFSATLPDDAAERGLTPLDLTVPIAELVLAAIEAGDGTE